MVPRIPALRITLAIDIIIASHWTTGMIQYNNISVPYIGWISFHLSSASSEYFVWAERICYEGGVLLLLSYDCIMQEQERAVISACWVIWKLLRRHQSFTRLNLGKGIIWNNVFIYFCCYLFPQILFRLMVFFVFRSTLSLTLPIQLLCQRSQRFRKRKSPCTLDIVRTHQTSVTIDLHLLHITIRNPLVELLFYPSSHTSIASEEARPNDNRQLNDSELTARVKIENDNIKPKIMFYYNLFIDFLTPIDEICIIINLLPPHQGQIRNFHWFLCQLAGNFCGTLRRKPIFDFVILEIGFLIMDSGFLFHCMFQA